MLSLTRASLDPSQTGLYFADGGRAVLAAIARSGEPVLPLTSWIIGQGSGIPLTAEAYFEVRALA